MSLSEQRKRLIAEATLKRHFPAASPTQRQSVIEMLLCQFDPNYSPVKREQASRHATGTGASFREFTIGIGQRMLRTEPKRVSQRRLGKILTKMIF